MALVPLSPGPALRGLEEPWRVSTCQASNDRGPLVHGAGFLEPPGRWGNAAENELAAGFAREAPACPAAAPGGRRCRRRGWAQVIRAGRLRAPLLCTHSGQVRYPCGRQASLSPRGAEQHGGVPRACELSAHRMAGRNLDRNSLRHSPCPQWDGWRRGGAGHHLRLRAVLWSGFPASSKGKLSPRNVGDPGLIPGLRRSPREGNGNPLQYSCLENSMDGGAWQGYSPWGCKELDMTEPAPNNSNIAYCHWDG